MYNLTNFTNANTIADMASAANGVTGGLYAAMILFIVFFIILITGSQYDTKRVLMADSFIVTVLASLFWGMGWIHWKILLVPVILLFGSISYYVMTK